MKTLKKYIQNDCHCDSHGNELRQSYSRKGKYFPLASGVAIIAILLLHLSSCKKFVEVPPPQTQLVTASVFTNNATATSAQLNIYFNMVQNLESFNISENNGLLADELTNYAVTSDYLTGFYKNAMTAEFGNWGSWHNAFNYIYQANAIIDAMQNNNGISPAVSRQLTGESKFIRAYWNFYLTNCFGDIPLALTTDYTITSKLGRTPRSKVLQQVITDLTDAQDLLNSNYIDASDTLATPERVRPNKAVATALLARAYLYLGDYSNNDVTQYIKAEAQATSVISNSIYSLSPIIGTSSVFKKNSSEAIWQLQTPLPTSNYATKDGQNYILISAPSNVAISNQLFKSFEANDQRKVNWIGSITTASPAVTYYFPNKYKDYNVTAASEYTMVLRLGEQYLIRAEARAQQGNSSGALTDLNAIRSRAGLANYLGLTDKTSLLTAILHERQVELFTEWGHRWFDLNRTGNTNSVMSVVTLAKGGVWSSDGHQALYPISNNNISIDPNLSQNPGY